MSGQTYASARRPAIEEATMGHVPDSKKKANQTKKSKKTVTTTITQAKKKQADTITHKQNRPGKEYVPLDEQENKKNNSIKVNKEVKEEEKEVKPFDNKCKKIYIFSNSV